MVALGVAAFNSAFHASTAVLAHCSAYRTPRKNIAFSVGLRPMLSANLYKVLRVQPVMPPTGPMGSVVFFFLAR